MDAALWETQAAMDVAVVAVVDVVVVVVFELICVVQSDVGDD